jgi:hypothetical protein
MADLQPCAMSGLRLDSLRYRLDCLMRFFVLKNRLRVWNRSSSVRWLLSTLPSCLGVGRLSHLSYTAHARSGDGGRHVPVPDTARVHLLACPILPYLQDASIIQRLVGGSIASFQGACQHLVPAASRVGRLQEDSAEMVAIS